MKSIELGQAIDDRLFDETVTEAVNQVVEEQVRIGVDIPGDGDMGRLGYARYIHERLDGIDLREPDPEGYIGSSPDEAKLFPGYYKIYDYQNRYWWMDPEVDVSDVPDYYGNPQRFRVTGPVKYIGHNIVASGNPKA